jgi:acyl-CoA synthetase (AMP-forming)/AMP-acid ligase II
MKPISLEALIRPADRGGDTVVSADGGWSRDQLHAAAGAPAIRTLAAAGSVLLCLRDPTKMLLALIALDGRVDRLLLLPADLAPSTVTELAERFGATATLTDRDDLHQLEAVTQWIDAVRVESHAPLGAADRATRWTFATSGTTGTPKLVEHDLRSLTRGLRAGQGEPFRWGQMYGMARFAGVQVMLQALAGGVLLLPDPGWPLARTLAFFADHGCDAISATPTLWRKMLMTPESNRLGIRQATLGGEIADAGILRAIADRFPDARVRHIYASTEAGASFAVADGLPGFPLAMLDAPADLPFLKLVDGRLFVRSQPDRATYVGSDTAFADADGFVDTGDAIAVVGDRCLFMGRANGAINVGGDKVYPQEVEQIMLTHPDVAFARIYAKSSPITGQIVVADVVPQADIADPALFARSLRAHCAAQLPRWKCPATIRVVADMAVEQSGKVGRAA